MEKSKSITDIEKIENLLKIGEYEKLFRVNFHGYRLYIRQEPFQYFSGLTGALSNSTFKGDRDEKRLTGWRNSMIDSFGQKNTDNFVDMTADFGSLLHMALVTIKEKGQIDWNEEQDKAYSYFMNSFDKKRIEYDNRTLKKIVYEYQKHVASLMQFVYDRVHEIYAIETPAYIEDLRIATPIDLYCLCKQTDKGNLYKTTINLKTSNVINKHQLVQVACEVMMWNNTYDEASCTAIMRTKDWTEGKTPTFEYKYLPLDEAKVLANDAFKRMRLCLNDESASYLPFPVNKTFEGVTKIGEKLEVIEKTLEQEWSSINNE
jgi:hypothetical protein